MLWMCTPAGFENLAEAVSVPAGRISQPPPELAPPEDAAEVLKRSAASCSADLAPAVAPRRIRCHPRTEEG